MTIHKLASADHAPGTNETLLGTSGSAVAEIPFSATAAASKVVRADANGKVDTWVTDASTSAKGKVELALSNESTAGLAVQASDTRLPSQSENDALAGTAGTPSSTNKYVTNDDTRNTNSRAPTGTASGDLSGTYPSPSVDGLQGRAVASTAPTTGQALVWNGSQWAPARVAAGSYQDVVLGPEATASVTTADDQLATATTFAVAVNGNNRPVVFVGGLQFSFGWATANEYQTRCFHARDSTGATVRAAGAIVSGDKLYFRGSVAGAQLDASDKITVIAARA